MLKAANQVRRVANTDCFCFDDVKVERIYCQYKPTCISNWFIQQLHDRLKCL